ncbi:MAG: putative amidohydrolase [Oceanicoccus sp.]|jgi:predicted amidohydrolase
MSHFSIASLQLDVSAKDNLAEIEQEIAKTVRVFPWVDMILLGELASFGSDPANAEAMPGKAEQFYCQLADKHNIWLIPGSMYEAEADKTYNTTPVINPDGEVISRYRKMFPFYPYEKGIEAGDQFCIFDVPDVGRFGVSICYDQWFPEVTRTLAWMGAEVILCPTMTNTIDRDIELSIARTNAVVGQCYFFNINVAGDIGQGKSIVVGPDGTIIYQAGIGAETIPIEIDMQHVRRVRERGIHGLGQTLKSFRDSKVKFPPYIDGHDKSAVLAKLGDLLVPARESNK